MTDRLLQSFASDLRRARRAQRSYRLGTAYSSEVNELEQLCKELRLDSKPCHREMPSIHESSKNHDTNVAIGTIDDNKK